MKAMPKELREPTCCCFGVRKTTLALAIGQAFLLFLSLTMIGMGLLRMPRQAPPSSVGYYVEEGDVSVLAISVRNGVLTETLEVEIHSEPFPRALDGPNVEQLEGLPEATKQDAVAIWGSESDETMPGELQVRIVDTIEVDAISPCRARRDALLIMATVGLACSLTVMALVGVCRVKPTYLLPYCCMHLCDVLLTAGALFMASTHPRIAREWLTMQRYVQMHPEVHERLMSMSDAQLHTMVAVVGCLALALKTLWLHIVCRCYSYLVKLRERRLINEFGLETPPTEPITVDHTGEKDASMLLIAIDCKIEAERDAASKECLLECNSEEAKRPNTPPPAYEVPPVISA